MPLAGGGKVESALLPMMMKFMVIMVRVGGAFFATPFFSGRAAFSVAKVALSAFLSLALFSALDIGDMPGTGSTGEFIGLCFKEFTVGLLIGVMFSFVFGGIQLAGEMMGFVIGYSMIQSIDPSTDMESSQLSVFWNLLAVTLFVIMNGHHLVIRLLSESYRLLPVGGLNVTRQVMENVISYSSEVFVIGVKLSAPVVVTLVVVDVIIGLMGRAAPSLSLMVVGMPLKILVGLFTMGFTFYFFPSTIDRLVRSALGHAETLLSLMR